MVKKAPLDSTAIQSIDLGHSIIMRRADGIIEIECSDNFEYDVEHIRENLNEIKKIAGDQKVLVLNCAKPFTTATKATRDFVASAPHRDFIRAEAFVIHTMGQSILGNFFLRINKPIVPAMFFKNKTDAEKWLKGFK